MCGLWITYSAQVPPVPNAAGTHTETDAETLMETVQECAETCARDGVRLHRQVQRRVWEMLYMPPQPAWPLYLASDSFNQRARKELNTSLDIADYERYWEIEKKTRE